ncbi:winged helix domain-containing protein [Deefgea sp. CFH1-16]|uniref:winged helix domain-containing protein n=1 Tax=Deefgea sp. CFH1-16 TaxID=2675457 RepID=UPI001FFDA7A2|nr:winged helix domain-containing protein [Deefgea sp. CFH1-16]
MATSGVMLDLKSQMLYSDEAIFINGELLECPAEAINELQTLANNRQLEAGVYTEDLIETLFTYYEYGYITLKPSSTNAV